MLLFLDKTLTRLNQTSLCSISNLKQAGILDLWLRDEITNASLCLRPPTADRREGLSPLSTGDLAGPFLLLAGGKTREREKDHKEGRSRK